MLVHPMSLHGGAELSISLENDNVIFHGSVEESSGVILRGTVTLDCHESLKVKAVTIKFVGKSRVEWFEGFGSQQRHYRDERIVTQQEWTLLPPKRKVHHLSPGVYQWGFALPLPGDLPETVVSELGQITYRLKAVVERPTFSANITTKRDVRVNRVLLPSSLELSQSMVISNEWAGKLSYNISVPSKVFSIGAVVPIAFDLAPIAPGLSIGSVSCALIECLTLTASDHTMEDDILIVENYDTNFPSSPTESNWQKTEYLEIPSQDIQLDTFGSELIDFKHKLKFTVSLVNSDGHISEIRASIPIIICPVASNTDLNELPAYEDAWMSLPYDAANLIESGNLPPSVALAYPNEAVSRTQTISSRSSTSDDDSIAEQPLPWQSLDLTRVPSYTTAIRSKRLYSFSGPSLPTYESAMAIPGKF